MKKPTVDYREFRLSRINEPRFAHLKYLLGWVGYFILYFLTENLIPPEACHSVHCALDDLIPFNEIFVIPYVMWYVFIVVSLIWFALYDTESFKKLSIFIIVTQVTAMAVYVIWPSRQDLRPEYFERDNILTWIMGLIYTFDTNTGVCPSLHVAYSIGIASVWLKCRGASKPWKAFVCVSMFLVCISVAFVKQHSVVDIFAALPVCLLAEAIAFGRDFWLPKLRRKSE